MQITHILFKTLYEGNIVEFMNGGVEALNDFACKYDTRMQSLGT